MLTIITGLPGHGKTLLTLSMVPEEYKDRDIYYHGIEELMLPWIYLNDPTKWHELPAGAVIVIDEAQQYFPLRQPRNEVPIHCSKFETHRHKGHDVILITQDAKLIDHHVRRLCGRHHHVARARTGHQMSIIWSAGQVFDPKNYHEKQACEKKPFKYPKDIYSLYKSAEVHTVKTHYPLRLILFPILFLVIASILYYGVPFLATMGRGHEQPLADNFIQEKPSEKIKYQQVQYDSTTDIQEYLYKLTPRIDNLPHTAPIYDEAYKVKTFPKPNCISSKSKCICYSQQATKLVIEKSVCEHYIENGYFDPTKMDKKEVRKHVRSNVQPST